MDTKFQASFIPKQPVNEPVRTSSGSNIFFLISFLIFIVSLVGAGGAYLWDKQLDKQIADVNSNLNQARSSFDQNTIKEFVRLNDKINAADLLMKQHVAPSVLFRVIGDATLKNVRFSNFRYSNAGGDKISVAMSGEAVSYEAVALQASAFTNPKLRNVFRSPIFSDPDLNASGRAIFSFTTGIDPTLLNYYKMKSDPSNKAAQSEQSAQSTQTGQNSSSVKTVKTVQSNSVDTSAKNQATTSVDGSQPVDVTGQQ